MKTPGLLRTGWGVGKPILKQERQYPYDIIPGIRLNDGGGRGANAYLYDCSSKTSHSGVKKEEDKIKGIRNVTVTGRVSV